MVSGHLSEKKIMVFTFISLKNGISSTFRNKYCPKRTVIANKAMFRKVKKINNQILIQSALNKPSVGTTFWWTLQEVTAANQGRSYSKVVFPPGNAPKSANKGCGCLLGDMDKHTCKCNKEHSTMYNVFMPALGLLCHKYQDY